MKYSSIKRAFDIILAIVLILLLLPFLLVIVILLKCTGEHRVFYLQKRIGFKNQPFYIYKFATMLQNSPAMGTGSITVKNDPRVLPIGRVLRKTKINELPQLLNVLNGTMSFVGPRPQMEADLAKFSKDAAEQMYLSMPGITGIGSIVFRDEERWISAYQGDKHEYYRQYIAPYKGELELWYHEHQSLKLDFLLLFCTACVVIFPDSNITEKLLPAIPPRPQHLR